MRTRTRRAAVVLGALVAIVPACAQHGSTGTAQKQPEPAATSETPELKAVLEDIDARAAKVTDLTGDFEQRKFTPLLKKPLVSSGKVRVRGPVVRWDTDKPSPSIMRIDDKELRIYYPDQKVVEVYPIGEDMRRLSSSPLPRLESIRSQFAISRIEAKDLDPDADPAKVVAMRLTPTAPGLKEHITSVRVLIDVASACTLRMEMTDPDGERTLIVFTQVKINPGVAEADVALKVPSGVRELRPLEGAGSSSPAGNDRAGDKK